MCRFLFLEKSPLVVEVLEERPSWSSPSSVELLLEREAEALVSPRKSSEQNPLLPTHSQKALVVLQVLE